MGHIDVNRVSYHLPDGRQLLADITFRVGDGDRVALVGPNGAGKTTLTRIITQEIAAHGGAVTHSGRVGVMSQFVGGYRDGRTVRDLLVSVSPPGIREAARKIEASELSLMERDSYEEQMAYAQALADWAEAGGYEQETHWDVVTIAALGVPWEKAQFRGVDTLSGGEQKRLVLESLLRGQDDVLVLDEPDNYLDVPGKEWLESQLLKTDKSVLIISHDRELLSRTPTRMVTLEPGRPVPPHGRTPARTPPTTRHASSATSGSTNCAGAGTRSTPRSRN